MPVLPQLPLNLRNKENSESEEESDEKSDVPKQAVDFSFEKQKITLRQRTKNAKRPVSKKFRNSMVSFSEINMIFYILLFVYIYYL